MKNQNSVHSQVFTLANILHWQKGLSKSEAFRKAWKVVKLKQQMRSGAVEFTYLKKDGTTRPATGTTSNRFFTYNRKTDRPTPATVVTYFDLEKNNFRSFKAENIA